MNTYPTAQPQAGRNRKRAHTRNSSGEAAAIQEPGASGRVNTMAQGSAANPIDLTETTPSRRQHRRPRLGNDNRTSGSQVILPRWQPDHEAIACFVCGNAFSMIYRKHHCRKCGRVVCSNCSQHRIRIPRKYMVEPPADSSKSGFAAIRGAAASVAAANTADNVDSNDADCNPNYSHSSVLVRVCNPCVPDPNLSPPHSALQASSATSFPTPLNATNLPRRSSSSRHQSHQQHHHHTSRDGTHRAHSFGHRNRTASDARPHSQTSPPPPYSAETTYNLQEALSQVTTSSGGVPRTFNEILASSTLPGSAPPMDARYALHPASRRHTLLSTPAEPPRSAMEGSSSYSWLTTQLRQSGGLCPFCHTPLPSTTGMVNNTSDREHLLNCVNLINEGRDRRERLYSNLSTPQASASSVPQSGSFPSRLAGLISRGGSIGGASSNASRPRNTSGAYDNTNELDFGRIVPRYFAPQGVAPERPRSSGSDRMFKFNASEKDCVATHDGNNGEGDRQECVICLEEFEAGEGLARLACFCKFHEKCIKEWWQTDTGKAKGCPTHKEYDEPPPYNG